MGRLILLVLLVAAFAVAFSAIALALRAISPQDKGAVGDTMPKTFSTIAYVLLIMLMFGVATGWLGAA